MLRAAEKREIASRAYHFALAGDFRAASLLRQQAYAASPPGSIGLDWSDPNTIWENDKHELSKILSYDCSDLKNSAAFISSMKAAYFVDAVLFDFRDWFTVQKFAAETTEKINCPTMESFLKKTGFAFDTVSRILVYTDTMLQNILRPGAYSKGNYYLGFLPGTPQFVIDGRRKWLKNYDDFQKMQAVHVPGFPKTYHTYETHLQKNDEKYQAWLRLYEEIKKASVEAEA